MSCSACCSYCTFVIFLSLQHFALRLWARFKKRVKGFCIILTFFLLSHGVPPVPSGPPRKVEVEAVNSSSIKVIWRSPMPTKQHGQIRGYQVHYVRMVNGEPTGQPVIKDILIDDAQVQHPPQPATALSRKHSTSFSLTPVCPTIVFHLEKKKVPFHHTSQISNWTLNSGFAVIIFLINKYIWWLQTNSVCLFSHQWSVSVPGFILCLFSLHTLIIISGNMMIQLNMWVAKLDEVFHLVSPYCHPLHEWHVFCEILSLRPDFSTDWFNLSQIYLLLNSWCNS